MKLFDRLPQEFDSFFAQVEVELIEPTEDEKKNGWTGETLTQYLREREAAQQIWIDPNSFARRLARRPTMQNTKYDPLRWGER